MSREDVRTTLASWEAESADYQARNAPQLNRWDGVVWGTWAIPENEIHALDDVAGLRTLELGCGAGQFGPLLNAPTSTFVSPLQGAAQMTARAGIGQHLVKEPTESKGT
jgi:hypothetical protein